MAEEAVHEHEADELGPVWQRGAVLATKLGSMFSFLDSGVFAGASPCSVYDRCN